MALRDDLKRQQQEDSLVRRVLRSGRVPDNFRINLQRFRTGEISAKDVIKEKRLTEPAGKLRVGIDGRDALVTRRPFERSLPEAQQVERIATQQRERGTFTDLVRTEVSRQELEEGQLLLEDALQEIFDVQQDPTGANIPATGPTGQRILGELGRPEEQFEDRLRQQAIDALLARNKALDENSIQSIIDQLKQGETIE